MEAPLTFLVGSSCRRGETSVMITTPVNPQFLEHLRHGFVAF